MKYQTQRIMPLLLAVAFMTFAAANAMAQERNNSWQFKNQNRASIAALIRDVEKNGSRSSEIAALPVGNTTNLICGKDGQTSAAANTTCVILNNSDGMVDVGQDSTGNQTATTHTESQESIADAVLETLSQ